MQLCSLTLWVPVGSHEGIKSVWFCCSIKIERQFYWNKYAGAPQKFCSATEPVCICKPQQALAWCRNWSNSPHVTDVRTRCSMRRLQEAILCQCAGLLPIEPDLWRLAWFKKSLLVLLGLLDLITIWYRERAMCICTYTCTREKGKKLHSKAAAC